MLFSDVIVGKTLEVEIGGEAPTEVKVQDIYVLNDALKSFRSFLMTMTLSLCSLVRKTETVIIRQLVSS